MANALVLIEPDAFIGVGNSVAAYVPQYGQSNEKTLKSQEAYATKMGFDIKDITHVSRPMNGIAIKPNTHAWVQVLRDDGSPIKLFNQLGKHLGKSEEEISALNAKGEHFASEASLSGDSGEGVLTAGASGGSVQLKKAEAFPIPSIPSFPAEPDPETPPEKGGQPNSSAWTDWLLQSVREQRVEKTQVVETFGDTYFYAFGERPRALQFQGLLLNSLDYNWRAVFWENWDRFFRATKLVEAGARMYIGWDDIIVEGYPINAAAAETADSPNAMTFQFTFYVTNYINTSAQSGFMSQKQSRISRIRGGYAGASRGKDPKGYMFDETHFLEWAGTYGATQAGGALESKLLSMWGTADVDWGVKVGGLAGAGARFLGASLSEVIDAGLKTGLGFATSAAVGSAFFTNWYRQFSYNTAKFWMDQGIGELERSKGWQPGEVNAWFGFLANILNRAIPGSEAQEKFFRGGSSDQAPGKGANPNWLGDRGGFSTGRDFISALQSGSIDRIIGALAFNIPAIPGYKDNTVYETAFAKGEPAGATMVTMGPLSDVPGASQIGPGQAWELGQGAPIAGGGTVTPADLQWS